MVAGTDTKRDILERLDAAQFLRAKLNYLAEQIRAEARQFHDQLLHKTLPAPAVPLNLVKTDDLSLTITVRSTASGLSEPVPMLFALDSFIKDLRGHIEFLTRALFLHLGCSDKDFSYSSFLHHIQSQNGQKPPSWVPVLKKALPNFAEVLEPNVEWLKRLTAFRTSLTHFRIRFNVAGSGHAVWTVGQHVTIKSAEDWKQLGPPTSQSVKVEIEGQEVGDFLADAFKHLESYNELIKRGLGS